VCVRCFIMFAEKLNDVRGYLVKKVTLDELFLSFLRQFSVISDTQKKNVQHVGIPSLHMFL